jgi:hypothetical protein
VSDEQSHPPAPVPVEEAPPRPPDVISAQGALRLLLVLLAIWTLFSGLALTFFQDAAAATIGGGLGGGEGAAAQRLLGVHLLVLGPLYGLLAWEPKRFRALLWVPYVAQGGVVAATLYDIAVGDRGLKDGALPLIVAAMFFVLLVYVSLARRPPEAPEEKAPAEEAPAAAEQAAEPS